MKAGGSCKDPWWEAVLEKPISRVLSDGTILETGPRTCQLCLIKHLLDGTWRPISNWAAGVQPDHHCLAIAVWPGRCSLGGVFKGTPGREIGELKTHQLKVELMTTAE